ncbi:hypothetical protein [Tolypothrix sp. VBCCA 56010]
MRSHFPTNPNKCDRTLPHQPNKRDRIPNQNTKTLIAKGGG